MIITNDFILINFPKTGSTFVRNVLKRIHSSHSLFDKFFFLTGIRKKPYFENLWLPNIKAVTTRKDQLDEHGICAQIPKQHLKKKIISVKRNLFERYVSSYEYGDWKEAPWVDEKILRNRFSNYPNLNFDDYINLLMEHNPMEAHPQVARKLPIGPVSSLFILYYFKNPFDVLKRIDLDYITSKKYMEDIYPIEFLDQTNLNQELYRCLIKLGYSKKRVAFILKEGKHNTSTPVNKSVDDYFSDELLKRVKEQEAFLFTIFNEYYV